MNPSTSPDETIQQITTRTEGWLVGLHLLALSLRESTNPVTLLENTKRHVSNIFSKLGVQNRMQAVIQAQELGLLDEEL